MFPGSGPPSPPSSRTVPAVHHDRYMSGSNVYALVRLRTETPPASSAVTTVRSQYAIAGHFSSRPEHTVPRFMYPCRILWMFPLVHPVTFRSIGTVKSGRSRPLMTSRSSDSPW